MDGPVGDTCRPCRTMLARALPLPKQVIRATTLLRDSESTRHRRIRGVPGYNYCRARTSAKRSVWTLAWVIENPRLTCCLSSMLRHDLLFWPVLQEQWAALYHAHGLALFFSICSWCGRKRHVYLPSGNDARIMPSEFSFTLSIAFFLPTFGRDGGVVYRHA